MKWGNVKKSDPCLFFGNISRTKTVLLRSIPNQTTIDWLVAECETRGKPPSEFEEIICDQCAYMHVSTTNVPSSSLLAVRKFIFSNILVSQDHSSHSTHWNGRIPISLSFFGLVWEIFPKKRQGSLIHTKKKHISCCIPSHTVIIAHITRIYVSDLKFDLRSDPNLFGEYFSDQAEWFGSISNSIFISFTFYLFPYDYRVDAFIHTYIRSPFDKI